MRRVIFFLLLISGLSLSFMTIQEYNYKNVLDTNSKLTQDSLGFNPDYQRICAKSKSIKSYIELYKSKNPKFNKNLHISILNKIFFEKFDINQKSRRKYGENDSYKNRLISYSKISMQNQHKRYSSSSGLVQFDEGGIKSFLYSQETGILFRTWYTGYGGFTVCSEFQHSHHVSKSLSAGFLDGEMTGSTDYLLEPSSLHKQLKIICEDLDLVYLKSSPEFMDRTTTGGGWWGQYIHKQKNGELKLFKFDLNHPHLLEYHVTSNIREIHRNLVPISK